MHYTFKEWEMLSCIPVILLRKLWVCPKKIILKMSKDNKFKEGKI